MCVPAPVVCPHCNEVVTPLDPTGSQNGPEVLRLGIEHIETKHPDIIEDRLLRKWEGEGASPDAAQDRLVSWHAEAT
jgi:hypothetical protein